MTFKIIFTGDSDRDLEEIDEYIAISLQEPATAEKQICRLKEAITKLDHLPFRHRLYDHEPWRSLGIRVFPVGNYLILYFPDESKGIVEIIRIIYGGRDIEAQLEQSELQQEPGL